MDAKQVNTMAGRLVEHQSNFSGLSTEDAQWVIRNPKEAIAIFMEAIKNQPKSAEPLLGTARNICTIPNRVKKFVVKESFARYRGSNFTNWLLGKVEKPVGGGVLRSQPLSKSSTDPAIIAVLGGNLKARIMLADINYAKKKGLLRKDMAYIGYMEDDVRFPVDESFSYTNEKGEKCVLRAVFCEWLNDDWFVRASSVDVPAKWDAGIQVFSRN